MSKDQLKAGTTGRLCDRAVVTGGAGFLGSHLCRMLVKSCAQLGRPRTEPGLSGLAAPLQRPYAGRAEEGAVSSR